MKTFFIATSNKGKQEEIEKFSQIYADDVTVVFPDASNEINVDESGSTFEENSLLKAQAYRNKIRNESIYYVGDDSGIAITALGNEPGVFTRRWAGYEMTDEEIVQYCLEKMKDLKGDARRATFQTVLTVIRPDGAIERFYGTLRGHIVEEPLPAKRQSGLPFSSLFWIDAIDKPIYELHTTPPAARKGVLSHREAAFKELFTHSL